MKGLSRASVVAIVLGVATTALGDERDEERTTWKWAGENYVPIAVGVAIGMAVVGILLVGVWCYLTWKHRRLSIVGLVVWYYFSAPSFNFVLRSLGAELQIPGPGWIGAILAIVTVVVIWLWEMPEKWLEHLGERNRLRREDGSRLVGEMQIVLHEHVRDGDAWEEVCRRHGISEERFLSLLNCAMMAQGELGG